MKSRQGVIPNFSVRNIETGTVDDIRVLAAKHRVRLADVITEAVWYFQVELGKSVPLPDGWSKPRDW